jgi:hypothetical protein
MIYISFYIRNKVIEEKDSWRDHNCYPWAENILCNNFALYTGLEQ